MKSIHLLILLTMLALPFACQKSDSNIDGHGEHPDVEGGNQELYDEVMEVHDEVMPKMNDIYKLKEELKKQVANAPDMTAAKKKEIESVILQLDSASEGMMVWMRNFDPIPDSVDVERAHQYLEDQKVKVEQVKEEMLEAIEKAQKIN